MRCGGFVTDNWTSTSNVQLAICDNITVYIDIDQFSRSGRWDDAAVVGQERKDHIIYRKDPSWAWYILRYITGVWCARAVHNIYVYTIYCMYVHAQNFFFILLFFCICPRTLRVSVKRRVNPADPSPTPALPQSGERASLSFPRRVPWQMSVRDKNRRTARRQYSRTPVYPSFSPYVFAAIRTPQSSSPGSQCPRGLCTLTLAFLHTILYHIYTRSSSLSAGPVPSILHYPLPPLRPYPVRRLRFLAPILIHIKDLYH